MRTNYTSFAILLCLSISFFQEAKGQSDNQEKEKQSFVHFHTRLVVGSPNYTSSQLETIDYDYSDYKSANIGGSAKLQFFNSLYGEYSLLFNLYRQRTSQFIAGIETPSKGLRLGVRYLLHGDQVIPSMNNADQGDLQMYLTLGGTKGGLEVALGNITGLLDQGNNVEPLALCDIMIRLNIALWSTEK